MNNSHNVQLILCPILSPLDFHPRMPGCTPTHNQLHEVTKPYRVYHCPSPKNKDGDYLVITCTTILFKVNT